MYEAYYPEYMNDLAEEDKLNEKIFKVYRELSELNKEFIIETANFERQTTKDSALSYKDDFDYNYMVNAQEGEYLYSPYYKNIVVNRNYLKKHILKSANGENVLELIDNNEDILNILVPQKLVKDENIISDLYRDWFYFQKVEVSNIYREARNQSKIEKSIGDLGLNIIYIEDDQKIFTYNPNSGDSNNYIDDTIITIYTENIDNSFLASCIGDYIFIESDDKYSALKEISTITKKYNAYELSLIASVYDKKGEEIRNLEENINNLKFNIITMLLFILMFMIVIAFTYYSSLFRMIRIKALHGYSFWQVYKNLIGANFLINIIALFLSGIFLGRISLYMTAIIVFTLLTDYLITKIVYWSRMEEIVIADK